MYSNSIDEPIVIYNDASTTNKNWLYADHLGSIVALANTTGAATANYTYSAEGKQGGSTASRFGYTGQQNLSGLGVQYYKARMYSADLGRFIQTDPIGMADDMNLYAYVGNNFVNGRDPSGLWLFSVGGLGAFSSTPATSQAGGGFVISGSGFSITGIGTYQVLGYGGAVAEGASLGANFSLSTNANSIGQFGGPFNNASVGAGLGPSLTIDAYKDPTSPVTGAGFTLEVGVGGGASVTRTDTAVTPIWTKSTSNSRK